MTHTAIQLVPVISDETLRERMNQIREVGKGLQGIDGTIHKKDTVPEKFLDLFFFESFVDPREYAFSFDVNRRAVEKAEDLVKLRQIPVYSEISGHPNIMRLSLAEVLSQVPEEILPRTIAFEVLGSTLLNQDYHEVQIIFYGKQSTEVTKNEELLPSWRDLVALNNKNNRPLVPLFLDWSEDGSLSIDVIETTVPVTSADSTAQLPAFYRLQKISLYVPFEKSPSVFRMTRKQLIRHLPEEVSKKVEGLLFLGVTFFRVSEGVLHRVEVAVIERI